jgi:hypothetical protein
MEVSGQLHNPAALPPGKAPLIPIWIGDRMGPRDGLDTVVKIKISNPCRDSKPPIIQPLAQRYTTELSQLLFIIIIL